MVLLRYETFAKPSTDQIAALDRFASPQLQTRASAHDLCPEAHDLVFRTSSGCPISGDHLAKHFRSILDLAGLPRIRLYDLRHSAATIALAAGVSPKVVSEQLGHASTAFTLDTYASRASTHAGRGCR